MSMLIKPDEWSLWIISSPPFGVLVDVRNSNDKSIQTLKREDIPPTANSFTYWRLHK